MSSNREKELLFLNIAPITLGVPSTVAMSIKLSDMGFFTAPASTHYHGAYAGGLFEHSLAVYQALKKMTEEMDLKWERPESPFIVGMFHDLCKCDDYVWDEKNNEWIKNPDAIDPDHGSKSIYLTQKLIKLTDEEIACIRWHMGAYETDTRMWTYYNRAVKKYPNVLWTHSADMVASQIQGV